MPASLQRCWGYELTSTLLPPQPHLRPHFPPPPMAPHSLMAPASGLEIPDGQAGG